MQVTAIVPVFNSKNTLERSIMSLLTQPEIDEIFIVDDGSIDGSFELAKQLEYEFEIIKVLCHDGHQNKGSSSSRNLGLSHAKNIWIQFLDADDELLPGKISRNILLIENNPCFVVGNSFHERFGKLIKRHYWEEVSLGLLVTRLGNTCSNLWNKNYILKVGGWNESLSSSQEYDLILRLLKVNSEISFCKDYLTIIHELPSSISRKGSLNEKRLANSIQLKKSIKDYLMSENQFLFKEKLFYHGVLGSLSKKNLLNNQYSKFYYYLFKIYKGISDRIYSSEFTMN